MNKYTKPKPINYITMASQAIPSTLKKVDGQYVKTCTHCGATLPLKYFSRHKMSTDGYSHMCRLCKKINARNRMSGIELPEETLSHEPKTKQTAETLEPQTTQSAQPTQPVTILVTPTPPTSSESKEPETTAVQSNSLSDLSFLQRLAESGFSITITIKKEGAKV